MINTRNQQTGSFILSVANKRSSLKAQAKASYLHYQSPKLHLANK